MLVILRQMKRKQSELTAANGFAVYKPNLQDRASWEIIKVGVCFVVTPCSAGRSPDVFVPIVGLAFLL